MTAGTSRRLVALAAGVVAALALGLAVGLLVVEDGGGGDGTTAPTTLPPTTLAGTAADIGFLQDMADHHGQAVQMASYEAAHGADPQVVALGRNILASQSNERGQLLAYLRDRGATLAPPDQPAMAWEGRPVPRAEMPGLVAVDDLSELLTLEGPALDARFLELMQSHHEGGVTMAEHGRAHVTSPAIADLAAAMVVTQREELADIAAMRQ